MTILRLTAHINGSVAYNRTEGLSIDGPLLYHATLQRLGEPFLSARPTNAQLAEETSHPDPSLGLEVYEAGGTWCYMASSALIVGDHGTEISHWNTRFDLASAQHALEEGILKMPARIQTGSGPYKSYHQPLFEEVVTDLVWYVVGDHARLAALLPAIRHLGKKRGSGHGRVWRWSVEAAVASRGDRWLWEAPNVLARPLPLAMLPAWSGDTMYAAYRPPYWLPAHQTLCAV